MVNESDNLEWSFGGLHDIAWQRRFELAASHLSSADSGAAEYLNLGQKFIPCLRRGTHRYVGECWRCHADVIRGDVDIQDVVQPGTVDPWRRPSD